MASNLTALKNSQAFGGESTKEFVIQALVDFDKTPAKTADVMPVLKVLAGQLIQEVGLIIIHAGTAGSTAVTGDYTTAMVEIAHDGWDATACALDAAAATKYNSAIGTDTYVAAAAAVGKYYEADAYITLTINQATTHGKVLVYAKGIQFSAINV